MTRESGVALAALRRATATDHASIDELIDPERLVEVGHYAAVVRGLIEAAEIVEVTVPLIPHELRRQGLSPATVSKRAAIDAESAFLDELAGRPPARGPSSGNRQLLTSDPPGPAAVLGLLYVYVGSGLGGRHLLRVARTAPWWQHDREHLLFQPYGHHLNHRWRTVLDALECLDPDETNAAVMAARAGFDVHRRSLVEHLSVRGHR
ncbi:biliverdin-producing heme oxygenase [Mycolicibacterium sp. CR10]|uniref:biliverdin-producing heme oxygenase n=1 Tax=Mycolicibacterium sp. CR10 TaxID=2562314 RepID=UPI0010C08E77|nr:biliverdin-producing heme oxygenase [Mycolicibacterium sp. CR10]